MGSVVKLKKLGSVEVLQEIIEGLEDNSITDFIVIARQKTRPIDRQYGITEDHLIRNYFFGEDSCVFTLGLLEYMKIQVTNWMREDEAECP